MLPTASSESPETATYFIRHGRSWPINDELRRRLHDDATIAINFQPIASCEPLDYEVQDRPAIGTFKRLADSGGVDCATYRPLPGCIIGRIEPKSVIKLEECLSVGNDAYDMVLKCLTLKDVRRLDARTAYRILAFQPIKGTITAWPGIEHRVVHYLRDGKFSGADVGHLSIAEQEVLCSEFLRSDLASRQPLPKLVHLLMPVGRTQEDVDIIGLANDRTRIFGQVTHLAKANTSSKVAALKNFAGPGSTLVMFCACEKWHHEEGVHFFPIRTALEDTLRASQALAKALDIDLN